MKPNTLVGTLLLILLVSSGCERKLFDHRKKYVGDWELTVYTEGTDFVSQPEPFTYSSTIVYPNAEITLDNATENGIIIDFEPNNTFGTEIKVSLKKDGSFNECAINGSFKSKSSMNMALNNWGHCNSYSAGGYSNQVVTSSKK